MAAEQQKGLADPRARYVREWLGRLLKLKADKATKLLNSEAVKPALNDFLDKVDFDCLVFTSTPGGLTAQTTFPTSFKGKAVYFFKKYPGTVSKTEKLEERLSVGDLPATVLQFLSSFVHEVLVPLVCRDGNRSRWPTAVAEDLGRQVRELGSMVEQTGGLVSGQVHLAGVRDREGVGPLRYVENAIASWDRLVDDILHSEPSTVAATTGGGGERDDGAEIHFWKGRFRDLATLHQQLTSEWSDRAGEMLRCASSAYWPVLTRLKARVEEALTEAEDLSRYLAGLVPQLEVLAAAEFQELPTLLWPTLHLVCKAWALCPPLRRPPRLVRLLVRLADQLTAQTETYVDPSSIFHLEIPEALDKLRNSKALFRSFRTTVLAFEGRVPEYFPSPEESQPWRISRTCVFNGTDLFVRRISLLQELLETAAEFSKLEKIEVGNGQGKALSARVSVIQREFTSAYGALQGRTADVLDPTNEVFPDLEKEYSRFKGRVSDWERRLGAVARLAFEDCVTSDAAFKLLSAFGSLLSRPAIGRECDGQMPRLLTLLGEQMDDAEEECRRFGLQRPTGVTLLARHVPRVSATLAWVQAVRERISAPVAAFRHTQHPIVGSDAAKRLFLKYRRLMDGLQRMESGTFDAWAASAESKCREGLRGAPLRRDPDTGLLSVNLDAALLETVQDCRYLRLMDREDAATVPFGRALARVAARLRGLVQRYNAARRSRPETLAVARARLLALDAQLATFETAIRWEDLVSDPDLERGLATASSSVTELTDRLRRVEANERAALESLAPFESSALFRGPRTADRSPLSFEDAELGLLEGASHLRAANVTISALVKANFELLEAGSESNPDWREYLLRSDRGVCEALGEVLSRAFRSLLDGTDPALADRPLLSVAVGLVDGNIDFRPALEVHRAGNLSALFRGLLESALETTDAVARLLPSLPSHEEELKAREDVRAMMSELADRVERASSKAAQYAELLRPYAHLWLEDRARGPKDSVGGATASIQDSLPLFERQVERYEGVHRRVLRLSEGERVDGWLLVDAGPFKVTLVELAASWVRAFKDHLTDELARELEELDDFVMGAERAMTGPLNEETLEALTRNLKAVKDREAATDAAFEPLKRAAELLAAYGRRVPDRVRFQLQELPDRWNAVKKLSVIQKQQAAPLQAVQVSHIRAACARFEVVQREYWERFQTKGLYEPDCPEPYRGLDQADEELRVMEDEMEALGESAQLFQMALPDFQRLRQCRRHVRLLKHLWDHADLVRSRFAEWCETPWAQLDIELMDLECKKFSKDIRALDKEMRLWPAFANLETGVKNMLTALRAVGELQNSAIRERHWKQLMKVTGVDFVMDAGTRLRHLLDLQLHNHEDEVRAIVDKAVKEMSVEKVMRELDATWAAMELDYEPHAATGLRLLRASEQLVAVLEDNQVQLQSIATSKHISHFAGQVTAWQTRLKTADSCIAVWLDVQRTWLHLESIFVSSEDIREQLPEDAARFQRLDEDFRDLVSRATVSRNVLQATGHEGLHDRLKGIRGQLTLCEKALAEYLEIKRLAFPRFYFVSSADLLDVLSNGRDPRAVMRHMTKLFDSLSRLEFQGQDGALRAVGMYARDGEYVEFPEPCDLSGQVESWLGRVLASMRRTVRGRLAAAVRAYEEGPRERWLFDYPAQVALCGTQIWWTAEVNGAFYRLEEGYDNALKDYHKKQVQQLNTLITMLLGELSAGDRQKIMTICTVDVHARDVVGKMVSSKVDSCQAFVWQSQLRHRWDEEEEDCFANVCDAQLRYLHEYLGNTPRLVITPLTDRCYITLTQSLHLMMGGAPTGPAGTGKTETTKDLGRALGIMVYVFNCSEQMDYRSCGTIYKGLAQSGAWGCFDEFNRISVEVLSVVAVQVKSIQDAIRHKRVLFDFLGERIPLDPCVGLFITMNPGYAGRSELPENLKALFRPCAMVVPDFELICEIMLVAEGFLDARKLARKFITLYTLCKELLSRQDHYDWGLRAIKSVLVVAGALKRADPGRPEDQVLMRALRDFNVPKVVAEDVAVFLGLIGDLFPSLDVPRKRNVPFEGSVRQACRDLFLQPEDSFVLKVVQLHELLDVRHSVFVIGNAGAGKTRVWNTLLRTYENLGMKPVAHDLDPKAVTNDELFGVINRATREWKDGLLSSTMRELANSGGEGPRWLVMDGDIDPMWIESLNTVMDDNKVLTLASNERIALTPTMRLLFEITSLKCATPATVSRAGILYINSQDLGWNPYVSSWIEGRKSPQERSTLTILFDKYVPPCLDAVRQQQRFKKVTPVTEGSHVQTLCYLLEGLLDSVNPDDTSKETYETYFAFACVWAFGSPTYHDQTVDHRQEFSKWWLQEFKSVKFPGSVFDYYVDQGGRLAPWADRVAKFERDPDRPLRTTVVQTAETVRLRYFVSLLLEHRRPVVLVGGAGCGKTVLVNELLAGLSEDRYVVAKVPFNFYTTSEMLQRVLEKPLEKKTGRCYGPPGSGRRLVYFVDDVNMPQVDCYGTVQPHTVVRQHLDYGHWYDRQKLSLKQVRDCQYVSCFNPTAGSLTVSPRLLRHFCAFAVSFPSQPALHTIYNSILLEHLTNPSNRFPPAVQDACSQLTDAALKLHQKVTQCFLPSALKFHYVFNLRDVSNLFQGLLFSSVDCVRGPADLVRLLVHEARRVYADKLVDDKDTDTFAKLLNDVVKKNFEELDDSMLHERPLVYCHFAKGVGEPKYVPVSGWDHLARLLQGALDGYNEINAAMNLVLFDNAAEHVCRVNRILESPESSALLVGVGGSGKQSLARLAAFIGGLEVCQITIKKGYGLADFTADLAAMHLKAGVKNVAIMFLMTDAQVMDERFLVLINDLLASGEIPDLFPDDEVDGIVAALRSEVRSAGYPDTKDSCWKFFMERVRRQLKVVLCFSPVGDTLRVRSRKFPAIVNCTCMDWFHEWPQEALVSVSLKFLKELDVLPVELHGPMSKAMAHAHASVTKLSRCYLTAEKRYNYTTPKSFLEQINLYGNLLRSKFCQLRAQIERLENGLRKLRDTSAQVDALKEVLAGQEVVLKQKNEDADKLIRVVEQETETVSAEKALAALEAQRVAEINVQVSAKQKECEEDLAKAEPALFAAQEALDTLNKNNLTELKSFGSPPAAVSNVTAAVMVLMSGGKIPRDRSWKSAKITMAKVDQFLDDLVNFDKQNIHPEVLKAIRPYLDNPEFQPDLVRSKSAAAAGLCSWVINIVRFYEVFCDVEPKRLALKAANAELAAAQDNLVTIGLKIEGLEAALAQLTEAFERASADKQRCQAEADATCATISLANRLVGALASENVRWAEAVDHFRNQERTLPGDLFLVAAFISYAGGFGKLYRTDLVEERWLPSLRSQECPIPLTEGLDPLSLLTDDAQVAVWNNEGLPNDRVSTENATIFTFSERWPLIIDPQLQGVKWIKKKYAADLRVVQLGQKGYLDVVELAVQRGDTVLLENIGESIDPVLDPLLGRNLIRKGTAVKMGDKEVEYHPNFRLILHTKLANPHYKPELQAQTTLINFTVTRDGLEDQLLAEVVNKERPELETLKAHLTKQQNDYKIALKDLEDSLLQRLSSAKGNILADASLVDSLEDTKSTALETASKVADAKKTEAQLNQARNLYRPAAARASLLYFVLGELANINPLYVFSLKAFKVVFNKAIERANPDEDVAARVDNLIDCITFSVFLYTSRGLFERDKLTFALQMTLQILLSGEDANQIGGQVDFLLRYPAQPNVSSTVDFLSDHSWGGMKTLSAMDDFRNLDRDVEANAKRWAKFTEAECPEKEKLPGEWKNRSSLQRLCILRALRPDRMTCAIIEFVAEKLGVKYTRGQVLDFAASFEESGAATPVFFILSPGVNPLKDVETLGRSRGYTAESGNFHNVSLGQGQEAVAEAALETAVAKGHWVVLQNIHLVRSWLPRLEEILESAVETSHSNLRVLMSAEPPSSGDAGLIPPGLLESAIKITNEPPAGIKANLHKALDNFTQESLELCTKEAEFKSVLFSMCYFHAVITQRRKFGAQGWNTVYPFSTGDLTISAHVLLNYLEAASRVPWEDLRYLFGEIMYGGHVTDNFDRRLCRAYLEEYLRPEQLEGELMLAPDFPSPPSMDYGGYHQYVEDALPAESPYLYGLHPNAEIGFLTSRADSLFRTVLELQPRSAGAGSSGVAVTRDEKVKQALDDMCDKLPDEFNVSDMAARVEERTPYIVVALQECDRMNVLLREMRRALRELDLGLKGELTITADMEVLGSSIYLDQVPQSWTRLAYPSLLTLGAWFADLLLRFKELESWTTDFQLPAVVWLSGFFNPQSFLTAIMQLTARRNEMPLDKMCLQVEVTKKTREEVSSSPKEGAYIHGLYLEGARWDTQSGVMVEPRTKELHSPTPVLFVRAVHVDKLESRNVYECPVYKTRGRGDTYVWTFNLKTKDRPTKWVLAGVALLLQI